MAKTVVEPATLDFAAIIQSPIADILAEFGVKQKPKFSRYKIVQVDDPTTQDFFDELYRRIALRMLMEQFFAQRGRYAQAGQG